MSLAETIYDVPDPRQSADVIPIEGHRSGHRQLPVPRSVLPRVTSYNDDYELVQWVLNEINPYRLAGRSPEEVQASWQEFQLGRTALLDTGEQDRLGLA